MRCQTRQIGSSSETLRHGGRNAGPLHSGGFIPTLTLLAISSTKHNNPQGLASAEEYARRLVDLQNKFLLISLLTSHSLSLVISCISSTSFTTSSGYSSIPRFLAFFVLSSNIPFLFPSKTNNNLLMICAATKNVSQRCIVALESLAFFQIGPGEPPSEVSSPRDRGRVKACARKCEPCVIDHDLHHHDRQSGGKEGSLITVDSCMYVHTIRLSINRTKIR